MIVKGALKRATGHGGGTAFSAQPIWTSEAREVIEAKMGKRMPEGLRGTSGTSGERLSNGT